MTPSISNLNMILHAVGPSEGGFQFTSQSGMGCTFASDVASRINRMTRGKEGDVSRLLIMSATGKGEGPCKRQVKKLKVYEELQKL